MSAPALGSLRTFANTGDGRRLARFLVAVVALHGLGCTSLLVFGAQRPAFLWVGIVAYTLGLRHAFDADHIAAIDNTTRKLMQQGRRPMGVGFFFAVGHSAVVLAIALLLGVATRAAVASVIGENGQLRTLGGLIGTSVGGGFLILLGLFNLAVLIDIVRGYREMRRQNASWDDLERRLVSGGLMSRMFGKLFQLVSASWQMIPIGIIFGLGFDTASEVALLAISAGAAAQGLPWIAVVSLPLVFAAAMTLMDTVDGAFMSRAYAWAFSNPARKVFYNMTMTGLSVFVALLLGLVEVSQILIAVFGLRGGIFDLVAGLSFGYLGLFVAATFVITWLLAIALYGWLGLDDRLSATEARETEGWAG